MLSTVIVNWNTGNHLKECLRSLTEALTPMRHEIVVVDNASSDNSANQLNREFPDVCLIQNTENVGFALAANQGAKAASGELLLLLNPDTYVSKEAIAIMVKTLQSSKSRACVGPLLVNGEGKVVRECRRGPISLSGIIAREMLLDKLLLNYVLPRLASGLLSKINSKYFEAGSVSCLQGSCFLIRREDWLALDGFDGRVPMYLDDGDLCKRLMDLGREIYYEPKARVIHYGGISVGAMANSRMTSLISSLAQDVYFLKHGYFIKMVGHHLFLSIWSVLCLVADIALMPFLIWKHSSFLKRYLIKHFWSLSYGIFFRFGSRLLPEGWPKSLRQAWFFTSEETKSLPAKE